MQDGGRPTRILLLIHELQVGGAETLVANLARALKAAGAEPVVCGWRGSGHHADRLLAEGIEVAPPVGPHGQRLMVPYRLARLVRERRIDLVHAHMSDSAFWAMILRSLCGTPVVVTHHSNNLTDNMARRSRLYGTFRTWLLGLSARRAHLNVVVSPSVRDRLVSAFRLPESRVVLIPNGVEVSGAARDVRQPDPDLVLFAGRLEPEKGIDILIEAVPEVLAARPSARFVILGGGQLHDRLVARLRALDLEARVELVGEVPNIRPWLEKAALLAVPSRVEGLPVTVLEAMAQGVPVVATDIPGNRDLIGADAHGRVCAPESPAALAKALTEALESPQDAASRARKALEMVRADYSLEAMVRRYLEAYGQALEGKRLSLSQAVTG